VYISDELVRVDFNVTIETEYADVDTEFIVAYFKDLFNANNQIAVELIDSIRVGQTIKLLFIYEAPVGEVFRLEGSGFNEAPLTKALFADITNFYVAVNPDKTVNEVKYNDNAARINIQNLVPDLKASNLSVPVTAFAGESLSVEALVSNPGKAEAEAGSYKVSLYVDGIVADTINGVYLAPRGSWAVSFTLPNGIQIIGNHEIKVVADSLNEVAESNETNNEASSAIDILASAPEIYSYLVYLDREPAMFGLWNPVVNRANYTFSIAGTPISNTIFSFNTLSASQIFQLNNLTRVNSRPFNTGPYSVSISRDGKKILDKGFNVEASTPASVISQVNDRTIDWAVSARFLKLMHYERINNLSFVWWALFSEKPEGSG